MMMIMISEVLFIDWNLQATLSLYFDSFVRRIDAQYTILHIYDYFTFFLLLPLIESAL